MLSSGVAAALQRSERVSAQLSWIGNSSHSFLQHAPPPYLCSDLDNLDLRFYSGSDSVRLCTRFLSESDVAMLRKQIHKDEVQAWTIDRDLLVTAPLGEVSDADTFLYPRLTLQLTASKRHLHAAKLRPLLWKRFKLPETSDDFQHEVSSQLKQHQSRGIFDRYVNQQVRSLQKQLPMREFALLSPSQVNFDFKCNPSTAEVEAKLEEWNVTSVLPSDEEFKQMEESELLEDKTINQDDELRHFQQSEL
ncbi:MAG: hypothetical protein MHM6MM_000261 [Cercozoa sp. M6MM]